MMASPIQTGDKVYAYLKELGYPERKIANWSMETRMYHDLGLYGDSAIEDVGFLAARFCVDMSNFVFDDYFPPEFEGRNWLEAVIFSSIPFLHRVLRRRKTYRPLTLRMIDEAMKVGRWQNIA
jgi:hypothetical protein